MFAVGDGALILSTVQATLVRQINSYLGIPRGTKDLKHLLFNQTFACVARSLWMDFLNVKIV